MNLPGVAVSRVQGRGCGGVIQEGAMKTVAGYRVTGLPRRPSATGSRWNRSRTGETSASRLAATGGSSPAISPSRTTRTPSPSEGRVLATKSARHGRRTAPSRTWRKKDCKNLKTPAYRKKRYKNLKALNDEIARRELRELARDLAKEDGPYIREVIREADLKDRDLRGMVELMEIRLSEANRIRDDWRTWIPRRRRAGHPAATASGTVGGSDSGLARIDRRRPEDVQGATRS